VDAFGGAFEAEGGGEAGGGGRAAAWGLVRIHSGPKCIVEVIIFRYVAVKL
jgi:hypothetical protein